MAITPPFFNNELLDSRLTPVSYIFINNNQAQAQYGSRERNICMSLYPIHRAWNHSKTQIGFLILTLIGVAIPFLMANPDNMIRTDGTKVTTPRNPSWRVEIYGLWLTLRTDPKIVLLFPMFLASNWFYTWRQFSFFSTRLLKIETNLRSQNLTNTTMPYLISAHAP